MRTLKDVPCNQLFILDDFGYENRGSYYLGEAGEFYVKQMVLDLISKIKKDLSTETLVTAGSSKGDSCALMFGVLEKADAIIAGAPQYFIGDYLDTEEHINIMKGICGNDPNAKDKLNHILPSIVSQMCAGVGQEFTCITPRRSIHIVSTSSI